MANETYFIYNGKFIPDQESVITPDNRSFRYGDGFFETMLFFNGKTYFEDLHVDRINDAILKLNFEKANHFTTDNVFFHTKKLISRNKITGHARVRITFFRGDGGLYDAENNFTNYIIQAWPVQSSFHLYKDNGLDIDIFPHSRKACDSFSHIKSNNYLCYAMAAMWAKKNKLNDAIVLNQYDRIADSTIANIFIVNKKEEILTPALSEGCVNGVMRRFVMEKLKDTVRETTITQNDLLKAKEIFLTNSIQGIMWVKNIQDKMLTCNISQSVFRQLDLQQL